MDSGGGGKSLLIGKPLDFPNSIRDIIITYSQSGSGTQQARAAFYYNGSSFVALSLTQAQSDGTEVTTAIFGDTTTVDVPNIYINMSATGSVVQTLHKLLIRGDYSGNPFDEDNC